MDHIIKNRKVRKTVYHVLAALVLIAGAWGFVEAEGVTQLLVALGTIFGIGGNELAAKNVPASEPAALLAE